MAKRPEKTDPIVIVGAGVFGLSTALHLGQRGYSNVAVFDKVDYDKKLYSYQRGCDAASADLNKIIRSAYGTQIEYQDLSIDAINQWNKWNTEISNGDIPPGMTSSDLLFHRSGAVSFNEGHRLPSFEKATIDSMAKRGLEQTQIITTKQEHVNIAAKRGLNTDQFKARSRGKAMIGVLDMNGGHVAADKACRFALHKARSYGVRFVLGPKSGGFKSYIFNENNEIQGIRTADGKEHNAVLTIMACGAHTPILVPQLDGICEATAGSVVVFRIPRSSSLFSRYSAENFPVWMHKMRDGASGGLYGFPINEQGHLKIGYRGTKYTNPQIQNDGVYRSVPITRFSEGSTITEIPKEAMKVITSFIAEFMPELLEEGHDVLFTRLCWYTDTFDNHFIIDRVPDVSGLMVATGGSGHAFKYLPNIGGWVVDVIEGTDPDRPAIESWKWRSKDMGNQVNSLMEGTASARALQNLALTDCLDERVAKRGAML